MCLACKHFGKPTNKAVHDDNNDQGTPAPKSYVVNNDGELIDSIETKNKKKSIVKSILSVLDVNLISFFDL